MEEKKIIFEFEVNNKDAQTKLEEINKALENNATAQKNLANAFANGSKTQEQYNKEQKLLITEQRNLNGTLRDLERGSKQYNNTLQGQRDRLADLKKEWANTNLATDEGKQRFAELSTEIGTLNTKILDQEKAVGTFTRQVGNYPKAFDAMKTSIDGATGGFLSMAQAFLTNPIGAIITAIVAGLALLNKAIQSNDETATLFKGVMAGLGVIIDNIFNTIAEGIQYVVEWNKETGALSTAFDVLAKAIGVAVNSTKFLINLFTGDFKGAANNIVDTFNMVSGSGTSAFDNITESMKASIQAGIEYEAQLDAIEQAQSEFGIREANILRLRNKALIQSKDLTKSEQERNALLEQAELLNLTLLNQRLELLDKQIGAEQEYLKNFKGASSERETIQFRLNDLLAERINLESEFDAFNEKAINKQNALIEKQQALAEKKREAEKKAAEERQAEAIKEENDANALLQRQVDAFNKLNEFKLESEIKTQEQIINLENATTEERISAIETREEKLKELETERVKNLLASENLLAEEKLLIEAKYQEKLIEIEKNADKEKEKIVTDGQKKLAEQDKADKLAKAERTRELIDTELALAQSFFQISTQLAQGDKELQKGIALSQAVIIGGLNFLKAITPKPPLFAPDFVSAGIIAATTAAQIATISAAAGGGDFVTTKPTLLLVGDNPGGRERVSVTPLSGRGKTSISRDSGMIAMAGGGTITTGSANASTQIDNEIMSARMLAQTLSRMPAPKVDVRDIVKTTKRVQVKENTSRLNGVSNRRTG